GAIGGLAYWGYIKAKQKVSELKTEATREIQSATNSQLGGETHTEEPCPAGDRTSLGFDRATVPILPGLTLAKVWTTNKGDYATLTQVQTVDDHDIYVTTSGNDTTSSDPSARTHGERHVCIADLHDGTIYVTSWGKNHASTIRTATMFSLSQSEFQGLKSKG